MQIEENIWPHLEGGEVPGGWRELQNKELHNWYCCQILLKYQNQDEMPKACSKRSEKVLEKAWKERDHYELGIDGRILQLIIKKKDRREWSGCIWLSTGTNDGLS
jgi:hypothetical protein